MNDFDLDRPVFGAKAIARIVNRTERQAYDDLEKGRLDGTKFGKLWASTPRRLLRPFLGKAADKSASEAETIATESTAA